MTFPAPTTQFIAHKDSRQCYTQLYSDKMGGVVETRTGYSYQSSSNIEQDHLQPQGKNSNFIYLLSELMNICILLSLKIFLQPDTEYLCQHESLFGQEGGINFSFCESAI